MPNRRPPDDHDAALRRVTHDLQQRVKELNCLFGISRIVERAGRSLETVMQETADLLPPSWEYPEIACARVVLDGREFRTANYRASPWTQSAPIVVADQPTGFVEVAYLEDRPDRDEGPFLAEERSLIEAIAGRLGEAAERFQARREMREREDELRERLAHLTRVSTMGELASGIAHEINQPLTAIATFAQACRRLVEAGLTERGEVLHVLQRVSDEALRAGRIIHRLNELVRWRKSKREACDLNALVREVEYLAAVDTRLHDVALRLDLAPSLPPVLADGVQIQQVVLNLIRNGVDAIDEAETRDREIRVRTEPHGAEARVSVVDTGVGLPEGAETRLFEPFFTTKDAGIGMGLAISRSIVSSHGGRMWFTRNPDRGATFFFTVPTLTERGSDGP
jgi:C4-dicarboxylate-specific signal transduction histidine kinase